MTLLLGSQSQSFQRLNARRGAMTFLNRNAVPHTKDLWVWLTACFAAEFHPCKRGVRGPRTLGSEPRTPVYQRQFFRFQCSGKRPRIQSRPWASRRPCTALARRVAASEIMCAEVAKAPCTQCGEKAKFSKRRTCFK